MSAVIPADRIIATALTGFGCLDEREFVVLGSKSGEPSFAVAIDAKSLAKRPGAPFMAFTKAWEEGAHPRYPEGTPVDPDTGEGGGRFAPKQEKAPSREAQTKAGETSSNEGDEDSLPARLRERLDQMVADGRWGSREEARAALIRHEKELGHPVTIAEEHEALIRQMVGNQGPAKFGFAPDWGLDRMLARIGEAADGGDPAYAAFLSGEMESGERQAFQLKLIERVTDTDAADGEDAARRVMEGLVSGSDKLSADYAAQGEGYAPWLAQWIAARYNDHIKFQKQMEATQAGKMPSPVVRTEGANITPDMLMGLPLMDSGKLPGKRMLKRDANAAYWEDLAAPFPGADPKRDYNTLPDAAPYWKAAVAKDIAQATGMNEAQAARIVKEWSLSGRGGVIAPALQKGASEIFGIDQAEWQKRAGVDGAVYQSYVNDLAGGDEAEAKRLTKAALKTMYDHTQAWFKRKGITHVRLFRGVVLAGMDRVVPMSDVTFDDSVLSSWSTQWSVANRFLLMDETDNEHSGVMLGAVVPVERIIGTPLTGIGCASEYEFVVLGANQPAHARVLYNERWLHPRTGPAKSFDPAAHPRHPAGTPVDPQTGAGGGRFAPREGSLAQSDEISPPYTGSDTPNIQDECDALGLPLLPEVARLTAEWRARRLPASGFLLNVNLLDGKHGQATWKLLPPSVLAEALYEASGHNFDAMTGILHRVAGIEDMHALPRAVHEQIAAAFGRVDGGILADWWGRVGGFNQIERQERSDDFDNLMPYLARVDDPQDFISRFNLYNLADREYLERLFTAMKSEMGRLYRVSPKHPERQSPLLDDDLLEASGLAPDEILPTVSPMVNRLAAMQGEIDAALDRYYNGGWSYDPSPDPAPEDLEDDEDVRREAELVSHIRLRRGHYMRPLRTVYSDVDGIICNRRGREVGKYGFTIRDNEVHIDLLAIAPETQKSGIAHDVLRGVADYAEEQGIEDITLNADITIGRYAWARYGFNYLEPAVWRREAPLRFRDWAASQGIGEPPGGWPQFETPQEVISYTIPGVTLLGKQIGNRDVRPNLRMEVGKAFMLDDAGHGDWDGIITPGRLREVLAEREKKERGG